MEGQRRKGETLNLHIKRNANIISGKFSCKRFDFDQCTQHAKHWTNKFVNTAKNYHRTNGRHEKACCIAAYMCIWYAHKRDTLWDALANIREHEFSFDFIFKYIAWPLTLFLSIYAVHLEFKQTKMTTKQHKLNFNLDSDVNSPILQMCKHIL